jgi:two-component system chemotaxis response regulator CheY
MVELETIPKDTAILVVDDIPSARTIVARFLKSLGFTNVLEKGDGNEAMVVIAQQEFSLVISDLHLKDMMGVDLLRQIRAGDCNKEVPFIVMTSDMSKESFQAVMKQGASTYLLKPFNKTGLAEKLKEVFAT